MALHGSEAPHNWNANTVFSNWGVLAMQLRFTYVRPSHLYCEPEMLMSASIHPTVPTGFGTSYQRSTAYITLLGLLICFPQKVIAFYGAPKHQVGPATSSWLGWVSAAVSWH